MPTIKLDPSEIITKRRRIITQLVNFDNVYAWVTLVAYIIQGLITGWSFSLCFNMKVSRLKFMAAVSAVSFLAVFPQVFLRIYIPLKTIVLFLLIFAVMRLLSEANTVKAFIFCAFDMVINVGVDIFLLGLMIALNMNDFQTTEDIYTFNRMVATIMFTIISIPLKYLYSLLWNKIVNRTTSIKMNPTLVLFPLAQIFAMIAIVADHAGAVDGPQHPLMRGNSSLMLTVAFVTFLIADIIYMNFISDIEKKSLLEQEVSSLKYAHGLEEQHFREIEEKRYEVAKIRHDINNQLAAIRSLVKLGHTEQADELLGELESSIRATKEYEYCSVPVINAVITEKKAEAEKFGITFDTHISLEDTHNITQNHLCSVFANLLDNAIRAEAGFTDEQKDKKVITVKAVNDSTNVYITVKNYVSGIEVPREDNTSLHGYGQQILRDIADIYSGSFTAGEENGVYTGIIVMKTKKAEI